MIKRIILGCIVLGISIGGVAIGIFKNPSRDPTLKNDGTTKSVSVNR